jgi:hypothetical protein
MENSKTRNSVINSDKRHGMDRQKMWNVGRIRGFFNAYSELQTGIATQYEQYDAETLCDPKALSNPKLLKSLKETADPHAIYLREDDCQMLYKEGWNEGHTEGVRAYETGDLELIGEIARLAGSLASFYTTYTTAENDARDCKVSSEIRAHFIINWRKTGGDKRKRKGV